MGAADVPPGSPLATPLPPCGRGSAPDPRQAGAGLQARPLRIGWVLEPCGSSSSCYLWFRVPKPCISIWLLFPTALNAEASQLPPSQRLCCISGLLVSRILVTWQVRFLVFSPISLGLHLFVPGARGTEGSIASLSRAGIVIPPAYSPPDPPLRIESCRPDPLAAQGVFRQENIPHEGFS